ncbi:MAG: glycosyltransferase family 2 protein [Actinomycetota bacterium]
MGPIVAIVPAFRAADLVGATVGSLQSTERLDRIVVVDDGSDDGTDEVARTAGAEVLVLDRNVGKGAALAAGLAHAPEAGTYLFVDSDLGETAAGVVELLDHVDDETVAIGVPVAAAGRGGFGIVRDLSAAGIESGTGLRLVAPLSGQRAVPASLAHRFELAPRFAVETAMTIDAVGLGARIVEVAIEVDHRHHGRTLRGVRHRAGQGLDVIRALLPRIGVRGVIRSLAAVASRRFRR